MKLLTKEIQTKLPPLYSQESLGENAVAYVKFFHPTSRYTYFATEFDGEDTFFGYCVSPLGEDCDEFGYASLEEISTVRTGPSGLKIERDMHFKPKPLKEALDELGVAIR